MNTHAGERHDAGYAIPPHVYEIGVGWDPQPEVNRMLWLASAAGVRPTSALELGCGTGRLLRSLNEVIPDVWGIELSPALAEFARGPAAGRILVGDMADFSLGRTFDLVFTSANTIRHIVDDGAIRSMWACINQHVAPGGVFIADLELGFDAEAARAGKPVVWTVARGDTEVRVSWRVVESPLPETRCCTVEYTFEVRGGPHAGEWRERFPLRVYDGPEFVQFATGGGRMNLVSIHEARDPYLVEVTPERAAGRHIVVFRRPAPRD